MYADESGDPGHKESLEALIGIRREACKKYGLPARTEMHGVEIVNPRTGSPFKSVKGGRRARAALYREFLEGVATRLPEARIINVYLDKRMPKYKSSSSRDIKLGLGVFAPAI